MPNDGADLELQGAIVSKLKADPNVAALVAGRIYDRVPADATFPYVTYGFCDVIQTDAECITGYDILQQIDVWSRAVGYPEAKRVTEAVRFALHDVDLELPTHALVYIEAQGSRPMRDPDGLTSHVVVTVHAVIEHRPAPVH